MICKLHDTFAPIAVLAPMYFVAGFHGNRYVRFLFTSRTAAAAACRQLRKHGYTAVWGNNPID